MLQIYKYILEKIDFLEFYYLFNFNEFEIINDLYIFENTLSLSLSLSHSYYFSFFSLYFISFNI